jgi:hypothetical protein
MILDDAWVLWRYEGRDVKKVRMVWVGPISKLMAKVFPSRVSDDPSRLSERLPKRALDQTNNQ